MKYNLPHFAHVSQGIDPGATDHLRIKLLLKFICTLRQLAYGILSALSDDLLDVFESISNVFLEHSCAIVITAVWPTYQCALLGEDIN